MLLVQRSWAQLFAVAAVSLGFILPLRAHTIDQEQLRQRALGRGYIGLYFGSSTSGYVFTKQEVLRTTDAGQTWQLLYAPPSPQQIEQFFFLNQGAGWIFTDTDGAFPVFLYRTIDGFVTMQPVGVDYQRHDKAATGTISNVFFLDADHGWALGGANHVTFTSDGGHTWTAYLAPRALGHPLRLAMIPPAAGVSGTTAANPPMAAGIAATDRGIIRTTDGGATWQPVPGTPPGSEDTQCDLPCVGPSTCMMVTAANSVFLSSDGGASWQRQTVPIDRPPEGDGRDQIYKSQLASPTRAYVFGVDTHIPPLGHRETTMPDGTVIRPRSRPTSFLVKYDGSTWARTNYENIAAIGVGQFVDDLNGWAVSSANNIFRTTDGGQTWTTVQDYFRQIAALTPSPTPFVLPTPSP